MTGEYLAKRKHIKAQAIRKAGCTFQCSSSASCQSQLTQATTNNAKSSNYGAEDTNFRCWDSPVGLLWHSDSGTAQRYRHGAVTVTGNNDSGTAQ